MEMRHCSGSSCTSDPDLFVRSLTRWHLPGSGGTASEDGLQIRHRHRHKSTSLRASIPPVTFRLQLQVWSCLCPRPRGGVPQAVVALIRIRCRSDTNTYTRPAFSCNLSTSQISGSGCTSCPVVPAHFCVASPRGVSQALVAHVRDGQPGGQADGRRSSLDPRRRSVPELADSAA